MNVEHLYPDPPHLSATVWSPAPEQDTFAAACASIEALGGVRTGIVSTAPVGRAFEYPYELQAQTGPAGDRYEALISGRGQERAVEAGFMAEGERLVVVRFDSGSPDQPHPVTASTSADILGIPHELWEGTDAEQALELSSYLLKLWQELTVRTGALYGSVEVERELPTPAALQQEAELFGVFFVSDALLGVKPLLLEELRGLFPQAELTRWPTGQMFAAWEPFRRDGQPEVPYDRAAGVAAGILVGNAVEALLTQKD